MTIKRRLFKSILFFIPFLFGRMADAQVVGGNAYMIGPTVEVAIHGNSGHEGTLDWPGHHSRGGTPAVPFGFVGGANPDWSEYDGDFFTAGTPENGFGFEVNGVNYSNNAWNSGTMSAYLNQIPRSPGTTITHTVDGNCITVEWQGSAGGVRINVKYHLLISDASYYTTEITMTNTTGSDMNNVYYYRNVDPDNNQAIGGSFATTNKIVSQPGPDCIKALVSAKQASPTTSYLGLGALGENFRVSYGGFSNRDGSDIWNAAGGLEGTIGEEATSDNAISLAYKTNIPAGESVNFVYSVILNELALEASLKSLYYLTYKSDFDEGGSAINPCSPSEVMIDGCKGSDITLYINGPALDDYTWYWAPDPMTTGDSVVITPGNFATTYTVTGVPLSGCLVGTIFKTVTINYTKGPIISVNWPDPVCGEFELALLDYEDLNEVPTTNCVFLTAPPDSATQTEPAYLDPFMGPEDEVWLMCGDSLTGCYDYVKLEIDFVGEGSAGPDTFRILCGGPGAVIDLSGYIADTANQNGYFVELTDSERLVDSTGIFNASNIYGTFVFAYIIEGVDECPGDTAIYTIEVIPRPFAQFEFEINGISSEDGIGSTCSINEVDFINTSSILEPHEIVSHTWNFGDGGTSTELNPSHTYTTPGTFVITLEVTSEHGCEHSYTRVITIYDKPEFELFITEPVCNGYTDGLIVVEPINVFGDIDVEIRNEAGTVLNGGTFTAADLGAGTYVIELIDASGCSSSDTITLNEPPELEIFMRYYNPPCLGDSGWAVVDSVTGESLNNPISYEWIPNPAGVGGIGADSSYWLLPGDYTVIATDSKGCFNSMDFTLVDPPPFYFTEWGWDTAYCRLFNYQSGNGVVYAAAAGGLLNYSYLWTYLVDGTTSTSSTWGGRNPGPHLIEITDAGGCVLSKIIQVDSVNPIASFTLASQQFVTNYAGTAAVEVEFTNTSRYFANPNDPYSDTLFLWDLDYVDDTDWLISQDFFEKFDTIYEERGETYDVNACLIAFNKNGCSDTACQIITIYEAPALSTVNVFSPNGDGRNDLFTLDNFAKGINTFECIILNRWGVKVGEITEIEAGWNGKDLNGDMCSDGVYFFKYVAVADNGTPFSGQGTVTLVSGGE